MSSFDAIYLLLCVTYAAYIALKRTDTTSTPLVLVALTGLGTWQPAHATVAPSNYWGAEPPRLFGIGILYLGLAIRRSPDALPRERMFLGASSAALFLAFAVVSMHASPTIFVFTIILWFVALVGSVIASRKRQSTPAR